MSTTESIGAISVSLQADLTPYAVSLNRGAVITGDFTRNVDRRLGALDASFHRVGASASGALKGLATGFVGGLAAGAVAEFTSAVQGAVKSVADLKAQAQQAGVGVVAFQKLGAAAVQARVGADALVDGLKELQLRGAEFATTGKGSAADAFARLGYSADDLKRKLADPSALFLEIIGRLQRLDKASQILNLDELFGGTGAEQFVRLVDLGADKMRALGDEAEGAGRIIDSALVDRAAELDAKFNAVAETIRVNLVRAVVAASASLAPLVARSNALDTSLTNLVNNPNLKNFNKFLFGESFFGLEVSKPIANDPAGDAREAQRGRAFSELNRPAAAEPVDQSNLPPLPKRPPNLLDYDPDAAPAIRTERDAVADLIASLEEEIRLVGASDAEWALSNNLRAAGANLTDDQRARIEELTLSLDAETKAQQAATEARDAFKSIAHDTLGGFVSDLRQGKSAADALTGALDRLADKLIDIALNKALDAATGKGGLLGAFAAALAPAALAPLPRSRPLNLGDTIPQGPLPAVERYDFRAPMAAAAMAIKAMESAGSGGYSALGAIQPDGDRAYGAYQVMGKNIGPWSEKWLGRTLSTQQFLDQPDDQDRIFQRQFGAYANKYGMSGAAQAWLGGEGSIGKLARTDSNGTSVGEYGSRFDGLFAKFSKAEPAVDKLASSASDAASATGKLGSGLSDLTGNVAKSASSITSSAGGITAAGTKLETSATGLAQQSTGAFQSLFGALGAGIDGLLQAIGSGGGGILSSIFSAVTGGGSVKAATGGAIHGPGSGTSDSIAAWLSNGEFVVNAASTRKFLPLLHAINDNRGDFSAIGPVDAAPRFAAGGLVAANEIRQSGGLSGGGGGSTTTINIIDRNSNAVTQKRSTDANGNEKIDVMIDAIVGDKLKTPGTRSNSVLKKNMGIRQGMRKI
ncbi:MAG TPA: hypothetical protein VNX29_07095 [Kaistia sp.]|nr:hypothetical protein [Kaistia sp.]